MSEGTPSLLTNLLLCVYEETADRCLAPGMWKKLPTNKCPPPLESIKQAGHAWGFLGKPPLYPRPTFPSLAANSFPYASHPSLRSSSFKFQLPNPVRATRCLPSSVPDISILSLTNPNHTPHSHSGPWSPTLAHEHSCQASSTKNKTLEYCWIQ